MDILQFPNGSYLGKYKNFVTRTFHFSLSTRVGSEHSDMDTTLGDFDLVQFPLLSWVGYSIRSTNPCQVWVPESTEILGVHQLFFSTVSYIVVSHWIYLAVPIFHEWWTYRNKKLLLIMAPRWFELLWQFWVWLDDLTSFCFVWKCLCLSLSLFQTDFPFDFSRFPWWLTMICPIIVNFISIA